jgi:hypothetical protein
MLMHARTAVALLALAIAACAPSRPTGGATAGRPPVAAGNEHVIAGLAFAVPAGYTLKSSTEEKVPLPIPGAPPTVEHFRRFEDGAGHGLHFFAWDGTPVRDRGPMVAAERWDATVGGEQATVSLTSTFFGRQQQVLVAHFAGPAPRRNRYMIYTTLVDRPAFTALLASARFVGR